MGGRGTRVARWLGMRNHHSTQSSSSSSISEALRHRVAGAVEMCGSVLAGVSAALPAMGARLKRGEEISDEGAVKIASDAYLYGYPLVTMEMTRRVLTNVAVAGNMSAPMGQFAKSRAYPDASFKAVTAPNADTLYTNAWLDLSTEPYVLGVPDMRGRYYLLPMLDAWTEVFQVPGKRTTGTGPQKYLITGPGWKGEVPADTLQYKAPTNLVWILGRIYSSGTPEDYAEVHALQDQMSLVPLSAYGKPYTPPRNQVDPSIDMTTAVRNQVNGMNAREYFGLLAQLMVKNPPTAADAAMLLKMAQIGIVPGKALDEHRFSTRDRQVVGSRKDQVGGTARHPPQERMGSAATDGQVRHQLSRARVRHRDRPRREPARGCGLSDVEGGRRRTCL